MNMVKCERCGREYNSTRRQWTSNVKWAQYCLQMCGVQDYCELAHAIGVPHGLINRWVDAEEIRIKSPDTHAELAVPVYCTGCEEKITVVPCVYCGAMRRKRYTLVMV